MALTFGWLNRAAACASARSRLSSHSCVARSFTATRRWSTSSYASQTTDMPPSPIGSISRYRPESSLGAATTPGPRLSDLVCRLLLEKKHLAVRGDQPGGRAEAAKPARCGVAAHHSRPAQGLGL